MAASVTCHFGQRAGIPRLRVDRGAQCIHINGFQISHLFVPCSQGVWMQSKDCHERASPYNTSESRSLVTIGQLDADHPNCVYATPDYTREMFYRNRACVGNREPSEEYKEERPLEFQAKCMVILIEESSRKALLDMLIAAGRVLDQPLYACFLTHLNPAAPTPHILGTPGSLLPSVRRLTLSVSFAGEFRSTTQLLCLLTPTWKYRL